MASPKSPISVLYSLEISARLFVLWIKVLPSGISIAKFVLVQLVPNPKIKSDSFNQCHTVFGAVLLADPSDKGCLSSNADFACIVVKIGICSNSTNCFNSFVAPEYNIPCPAHIIGFFAFIIFVTAFLTSLL